MKEIIQSTYQVFDKYPIPKKVIEKECNMCFNRDDEDFLLHTPLTKLNIHILERGLRLVM